MPKPFYEDKWVKIFHGDCREILPTLDVKVDLVLTDPPYGLNIAKTGKVGGMNKAQPKQYIASDWDSERLNIDIINVIRSKSVNQIIFGGNYIADLLPPSPCWIVWDKDNTGNFADCELAWTSFKTATRKYLWRWNGMLQEAGTPKEYRYHPTQKPDGLFSAILSGYSLPEETILDPFLGSGTTCYCAKKLNRYSIGLEIEEKYCEIAAKRCMQESFEFDLPTQSTEKQVELSL
jgi:site-specific DNA-methyltransferase (adenine-specific)